MTPSTSARRPSPDVAYGSVSPNERGSSPGDAAAIVGDAAGDGSILRVADPQVWASVQAEERRQAEGIELIASENFVSRAVLEATGTVLTNKYAEGVPGRRYYGGCEFVDEIEALARSRAMDLFGAAHANVQPHSGAQANFAAYLSCLDPGDRMLGMSLSHGGHLTHGSSVNFSGRLFEFSYYGVREEDGLIDYDHVRDAALKTKPKVIVAGASAYPRIIDYAAFGEIARELNVPLVVDMAHVAGLVAGGSHPSPVPHADIVTSTTHKTLRGPRGGIILCREDRAKSIDKSVFPFAQGGPLVHVIAAKAVAFQEAASTQFVQYAASVVSNAKALAGALTERGFRLVSGGTDTHLVLMDLRDSHPEVSGMDAEVALGTAGITVNKNTVPGESRSPFVTSGLRLGTAAVTTRCMGEGDMERVASWMDRVLAKPDDERVLAQVRAEIEERCASLPAHADSGPFHDPL